MSCRVPRTNVSQNGFSGRRPADVERLALGHDDLPVLRPLDPPRHPSGDDGQTVPLVRGSASSVASEAATASCTRPRRNSGRSSRPFRAGGRRLVDARHRAVDVGREVSRSERVDLAAVHELSQVHVSVADATKHRLERRDALTLANGWDDVPALKASPSSEVTTTVSPLRMRDDAGADRVDGGAVGGRDVDAEVVREGPLAVQAGPGVGGRRSWVRGSLKAPRTG